MKDLTIDDICDVYNHRRPGFVGKHRSYSILMPIVEFEDGLHFLFELRSAKLDRQPGEVCFPGGAIEDGETPMQAAIRETMEELGLERKDITIINKADSLQTHANNLLYSYIGLIRIDNMKISEEEVEEVFTVPLSFFMNNEPDMEYAAVIQKVSDDFPYDRIKFPKGYKWANGRSDIPIYEYEDKIIWGLTGRLVHDFVEVMKGERP
jgi:8-oxo-dGTP pyrophosphatase MutT (NUDIX family)